MRVFIARIKPKAISKETTLKESELSYDNLQNDIEFGKLNLEILYTFEILQCKINSSKQNLLKKLNY